MCPDTVMILLPTEILHADSRCWWFMADPEPQCAMELAGIEKT
jgi:hypothetical protein